MKKLICLLMALAVPAFAVGSVEYGLHGGLLLPTGDAGDFYSTSFLLGGNILAHMPMFAIEGSISYGILQEEEELEDFSASLIPILAGIRSYSGFVFYGGGVGLYMASAEYTAGGITYDASDEEFGLYGNLGMIFPSGSMDIEGSIKYHLIDFDTDNAWIGLTAGLNF